MLKNPKERVNHPDHYQDGSNIECIEVMENMDILSGTAFKYLFRAGKKGSSNDKHLEDLDKAIWYIERRKNRKNPAYPNTLDQATKNLIANVANYRENSIKKAMLALSENAWDMAIESTQLAKKSITM